MSLRATRSQGTASTASPMEGVTTATSPGKNGDTKRDWDLVVIGGGSGGMAAAKEAAKLGARVALFDYVKPSTQGSRWGLGGTCVNVGCVPKKICHYAGLLGEAMRDAHELGWKVSKESEHDWAGLTDKVMMQRGQLNWSYKQGLRSAKVTYINALASFTSPHTVKYVEKGQEKEISADSILIAVGGRPSIPADVPGALEHAITSDDIFTLDRSPGKTLCVGGSYIALECAGFLSSLGQDVTVAYRSILLRGFDRQCADKIGSIMAELGTRFLPTTLPSKIVKKEDGKLEVSLINAETKEVTVQTFDTVLFATGRAPDVKGLNLEAAGLKVTPSGKFQVDKDERTNVDNIYAVGDVLEGKQELTPVAIKAGELLARRLYSGSNEAMDYSLVPTTVFTPTEYGCVGLSEEDAIAKHGEDDVEVFLSEYMTLEIAATHRTKHPRLVKEEETDGIPPDLSPMCLAKLVCLKPQDNKVIGFHYVGPNAGEVTQGFALGLRLGAKKRDFDSLVGIHPTDAEAFTQLTVTKRSGESYLNDEEDGIMSASPIRVLHLRKEQDSTSRAAIRDKMETSPSLETPAAAPASSPAAHRPHISSTSSSTRSLSSSIPLSPHPETEGSVSSAAPSRQTQREQTQNQRPPSSLRRVDSRIGAPALTVTVKQAPSPEEPPETPPTPGHVDQEESCFTAGSSSVLDKVENQPDEELLAAPSIIDQDSISFPYSASEELSVATPVPPTSRDERSMASGEEAAGHPRHSSDRGQPGGTPSAAPAAAAATGKRPSSAPLMPHTEAWQRAGGRLAGERVREIIRQCKGSKPNLHLRDFAVAKDISVKGDHAIHVSSPCPVGVTLGRRPSEMIASAIFEHKDFLELKDLDVDTVLERRLQAEKYLNFEVVASRKALMFDARKYATAANLAKRAGSSKRILLKVDSKKKKKRTVSHFAIAQDLGSSHLLQRAAHTTHKKTLYSKLKSQVKQQKNTNHLGDLIAANNIDYPASELLLQRAFMLLAETFGPHDKRTQPTLRRLRDCYLGQGVDKEKELKELTEDTVKHMERITLRLAELDAGVKAMKHTVAIHSMDRQFLRAGKRARERLHRRSLKEGEYQDLIKAQQLIHDSAEGMPISPSGADPRVWFTSDRLNKRQQNSAVAVAAAMGISVSVNQEELPEQVESIKTILAHIERADYLQVSERSRHELSKCLHNPPMMDIFHSSLLNMKHFPHMSDFQVRVRLSIDGDVIIGDTLVVRYDFKHRLKPYKLHSPKDWIGIFRCPSEEDDEDEDEDNEQGDKKPEKDDNKPTGEKRHPKLVLWKFMNQPQNVGQVQSDYILMEGRQYIIQYFISMSECAVATTQPFTPRFPRATIRAPDKIVCGRELRVYYHLDYRYRLHDPEDFMGIYPHDQTPSTANCVQMQRLPKSNEGMVVFETGILLPGVYRVAVFIERHDHQVIGTSDPVSAAIEFYYDAHRQSIQQRDVSVCLLGRWDMDMEMTTVIDRVAPKLKQFCDDRFCALNVVNLEEQLDPSGVVRSEDVHRILWYIEHCHPFFLFCLGDQVSQHVNETVLDLSKVNLECFPWLRKVPWKHPGQPTLTELVLEACFHIPMMMDHDMATYNQFYFADMTLRSRRHPCYDRKGTMEALAALNFSRMKTKQVKREVLHKSQHSSVSEYVSDHTLSSSLLENLTYRLTDAYPTDEPIDAGDYIGMQMNSRLHQQQRQGGYRADLESCRYVQHVKVNGSILYSPCASSSVELASKGGSSNIRVRDSGSTSTRTQSDDRESLERSSSTSSDSAGTVQVGSKTLSLFELLDNYANRGEPDHKPLIIVDRVGSGVSSVLAYWLQSYTQKARQVLMDTIPQYGPCRSRVLLVNEETGMKQLLLYVDMELVSHRLDTASLIYYILSAIKGSCTSMSSCELPDPNIDLVPVFFDWLQMIKNEYLVLVLDGLDYMPNRSEDPLDWLPLSLTSWVRIIGTALPIGRVVYACNGEARLWTLIRRKSELSVSEKEAVVDEFLRKHNKGVLKEWVWPLIKSDKTSAQGPLRACMQEMLTFMPDLLDLKPGINEKKVEVPSSGSEDAEVISTFKTKMQDLMELPDVRALIRARIQMEVAACPPLKDVLCLLRMAQRGLSELELVMALLRHQDNDAELAVHRKKLGPAYVAPGCESWGGDGEVIDGALRLRHKPRKGQEPLSRRFNAFRRDQWIGIHARLMRGGLLAKKVMGLYMLKDPNVQRAVDTCFFDTDQWRMPYLTTLIDTFFSDLPSQRKANELAFFLYRSLRTAVKIENAATLTAAAVAAAAPPGNALLGQRQPMRTSINKIMDKLFEVLTDTALFRHLNTPFRRSIYNEYMYQTGVRDTDIYIKMTQKFEKRYGIIGRNVQGPKHYQLSVVPDRNSGGVTHRDGSRMPPVSLPLEGVKLLLKLGTYFFHHLRLYDAGQEVVESALLILFESRAFDSSILEDRQQKMHANLESVPTIIETLHTLARIYMMRFVAYYEEKVSMARSTEVDHASLYHAYSAMIGRTPRPRTKAMPFKSSYELFMVAMEEDEEKEARQAKKEVSDTSSVDMEAVIKTQRTKLQFEPTKIQSRFQLLDRIMEKVAVLTDQRVDVVCPELHIVVGRHYPLLYKAWTGLWTRYQSTPFAKAQASLSKTRRTSMAGSKKTLGSMSGGAFTRRHNAQAMMRSTASDDFLLTRPVDRQMMFKTTIKHDSMRSPVALAGMHDGLIETGVIDGSSYQAEEGVEQEGISGGPFGKGYAASTSRRSSGHRGSSAERSGRQTGSGTIPITLRPGMTTGAGLAASITGYEVAVNTFDLQSYPGGFAGGTTRARVEEDQEDYSRLVSTVTRREIIAATSPPITPPTRTPRRRT